MPMTTLENDTLNKLFVTSLRVLEELLPRLQSLDAIYNSTGGVKETLSQEELDARADLSGLTKQTCDDGAYALTAVVLPGIVAASAALNALAARYRGMLPPLPPLPI